jgi:hypothetical protein
LEKDYVKQGAELAAVKKALAEAEAKVAACEETE